jgi:hypothetical protein
VHDDSLKIDKDVAVTDKEVRFYLATCLGAKIKIKINSFCLFIWFSFLFSPLPVGGWESGREKLFDAPSEAFVHFSSRFP